MKGTNFLRADLFKQIACFFKKIIFNQVFYWNTFIPLFLSIFAIIFWLTFHEQEKRLNTSDIDYILKKSNDESKPQLLAIFVVIMLIAVIVVLLSKRYLFFRDNQGQFKFKVKKRRKYHKTTIEIPDSLFSPSVLPSSFFIKSLLPSNIKSIFPGKMSSDTIKALQEKLKSKSVSRDMLKARSLSMKKKSLPKASCTKN